MTIESDERLWPGCSAAFSVKRKDRPNLDRSSGGDADADEEELVIVAELRNGKLPNAEAFAQERGNASPRVPM